jgi:hypothetical protein
MFRKFVQLLMHSRCNQIRRASGLCPFLLSRTHLIKADVVRLLQLSLRWLDFMIKRGWAELGGIKSLIPWGD